MRRSLRAVSLVAVVAAAAAAWFFLAPPQLGGSTSYAVVYGSSMEPRPPSRRPRDPSQPACVPAWSGRRLSQQGAPPKRPPPDSRDSRRPVRVQGRQQPLPRPRAAGAEPALRPRVDRPAARRRIARTAALAPRCCDCRRARGPPHPRRRLRRRHPQASAPGSCAKIARSAGGRHRARAAASRASAPTFDSRRVRARACRDVGRHARRRCRRPRCEAAGAADRRLSGLVCPTRCVLVVVACAGRGGVPVAVAPSFRPRLPAARPRARGAVHVPHPFGAPVRILRIRKVRCAALRRRRLGNGASCSRTIVASAGTGSCSPASSTCRWWRTLCAGSRRRPACTTPSGPSRPPHRACAFAVRPAGAAALVRDTRSHRRSRSTSTTSGYNSRVRPRASRRRHACRRRPQPGRGPFSPPSPSSASGLGSQWRAAARSSSLAAGSRSRSPAGFSSGGVVPRRRRSPRSNAATAT